MIALLRSEFRKLLSVRSTYVISGIALLFIGFMAFYIEGFRGTGGYEGWLMNLVNNSSTTISVFVAIVAILLMGHEYRYNTIMYTLTATNSRTKVMLAKVAVVIGYAFAFTLLSWIVVTLAYIAGANLSPIHGQAVIAPDFVWDNVWRSAYFVVGFGLIGLLLAFLLRSLVGAIAVMFVWPTAEAILSPLLRHNARYLPFNILQQIHFGGDWGPGMAALLFVAYMIVAWSAAWYLFVRRDAN